MKLARMTLHMTIAAYLNKNPDRQVVLMAKRYMKRTIDPSVRRTLKIIITSPKPALLVKRVYVEQFKGQT